MNDARRFGQTWVHYVGTYSTTAGKALLYINGAKQTAEGTTSSPVAYNALAVPRLGEALSDLAVPRLGEALSEFPFNGSRGCFGGMRPTSGAVAVKGRKRGARCDERSRKDRNRWRRRGR